MLGGNASARLTKIMGVSVNWPIWQELLYYPNQIGNPIIPGSLELAPHPQLRAEQADNLP